MKLDVQRWAGRSICCAVVGWSPPLQHCGGITPHPHTNHSTTAGRPPQNCSGGTHPLPPQCCSSKTSPALEQWNISIQPQCCISKTSTVRQHWGTSSNPSAATVQSPQQCSDTASTLTPTSSAAAVKTGRSLGLASQPASLVYLLMSRPLDSIRGTTTNVVLWPPYARAHVCTPAYKHAYHIHTKKIKNMCTQYFLYSFGRSRARMHAKTVYFVFGTHGNMKIWAES